MPITLVKGSSILASFDRIAEERLKAGRYGSFVVVVPTRRRIRELNRLFIRQTPGAAAGAFPLFTLGTLVHAVAAANLPARKPVPLHVQAVLMQRAIDAVADGLVYFSVSKGSGRKGLSTGTFQKLASVVNGLREAGVGVEELRTEVEANELGEGRKLAEVLAIMEAYEAQLGNSFADPALEMRGVLKVFASEAPQSVWWNAFPSKPDVLFIDGFDEFARPEFELLEWLATVPGLTVVLNFDFHPANEDLFFHLEDNYHSFSGIGFRPPDRPSRAHVENSPGEHEQPAALFHEHVRRNLFRHDDTIERIDAREFVTLIEAADREAEVDTIARIIKARVVEKPEADLSRICVATAHSGAYTPLFREAFARYGIPANITDRYRLDASPLVVGILALGAVVENNFRRRDLLRALTSPYVRPGVDAANLESVSAGLRITAGARKWEERIESRLSVVENQLRTVDDELELSLLEREARMLRKGLDDFRILKEMLAPLSGEHTPAEFHRKLLDLLDKAGVESSLRPHRGPSTGPTGIPGERWEDAERDSRAFATFLSVLEDVVRLRESQNPGPAPLFDYLADLKGAVSLSRYNIRQRYGYGVYVTSIEETRGLSFDTMFIAGLVDGEFPAPYQSEVFLSVRRMAEKRKRFLFQERYLFYQASTNFKRYLYLTYPAAEGNAKELVTSSFVNALKAIADVREWKKKDGAEDQERVRILHGIWSRDELLRRVSEVMWREGSRPDHPAAKEVIKKLGYPIHVEQSRAGEHTEKAYEGFILDGAPEDMKETIAARRGGVYSVSQLETYAQCPFKFFAQRLLKLTPIEEVEEGITPLEKGNLLHQIFFEFFTRWRDEKQPPLRECSEVEFKEATDLLLSMARARLDLIHINAPLWELDKEELLGGPGRPGVMREFLENERRRPDMLAPRYFEASFGGRSGRSDAKLSSSDPVKIGDVLVRGKIDRIDVDDTSGLWIALDYKTGKIPPAKGMWRGEQLQLPVYALAIRELRNRARERAGAGPAGAFYLAKEDEVEIVPQLVPKEVVKNLGLTKKGVSPEEYESIVDGAGTFIRDYVTAIAEGRFPLTSSEKVKYVCKGCDYRMMCRIWVSHQPGEGREGKEGEE